MSLRGLRTALGWVRHVCTLSLVRARGTFDFGWPFVGDCKGVYIFQIRVYIPRHGKRTQEGDSGERDKYGNKEDTGAINS